MTKGRFTSRAFAMAIGAFVLIAVPGQAQEPAAPPIPAPSPERIAEARKFSFYAGYAFLHTEDGELHGLSISPEYRLNGLLSAVVDVGSGKGTLDGARTIVSTFLGGLRLRKAVGSAAVFVHALAGGARTSASVDLFDGVSISVADTGMAFGGGGGIDFRVSRVKLRIGVDYLMREVDAGSGTTENKGDIRAGVGIVF